MTHQHDRAGGVFRDLFGRQPQIAAAAPGRVNLIGEHVDYCGGFVLPMAIERETVIVAARRTVVAGEPVARVHSTACHETVELPLGTRASRPRGGGGWSQYVAGVLAGFVDRGVVIPPFDAVIDSTVPLGGGLSSSASLEVAVATLVATLAGHAIEPLKVAAVRRAGRVLSWPSRARAGVSVRLAMAAGWHRQLRISSTASFPRCPCGSG